MVLFSSYFVSIARSHVLQPPIPTISEGPVQLNVRKEQYLFYTLWNTLDTYIVLSLMYLFMYMKAI